jgi:hypothetical protein
MTALRKILVEEVPVVAVNAVRAPAAKLYVVTNNAPAETRVEVPEAPEAAGNALVNVLLFFAAPFIGLAYIVAFPLVGLGALALLAVRAAAKVAAVRAAAAALKNVALVVAAPVLGLAYVVFFPFIGLTMLAWLGGRAAVGAARGV